MADQDPTDSGMDAEAAAERLEQLFEGKYRPVQSAAEADAFYTTEHFFAIIDKHAPQFIPPHLFRDAMVLLGFREHVLQDSIVWLVATGN